MRWFVWIVKATMPKLRNGICYKGDYGIYTTLAFESASTNAEISEEKNEDS